MAGMPPMVKLEDDVLRKFYRSFHKHGAANLAKVAKETKLMVEQCEMLHKQHMSFLGLSASAAFETAFLALVNDHYNATQKRLSEELQEDDSARGSRPTRRGTGEPDEAEANATVNSSQKPKRTPKPTPQRLAAEEELQARRQARSNQSTPKSAKSKMAAKAPPSPPPGEWNSSQRKRSRRLFEDTSELDVPRYRSPVIDRWRGRLISDVDEGVDALLSLASGAHASSNLDEHHSGPDIATTTADPVDGDEAHETEPLQGTPKRARGGRVGRATPTPIGTPLKGAARSTAAATTTAGSDGLPMPSATGIRSPRGRGGVPSATAAANAATSGRGHSASGSGKQLKERSSPTKSTEHDDEAEAEPMSEAGDVGNASAGAGAGETATEATAAATGSAIASGPAPSPGLVSPSGRPVRKRKPTAIALAAAAAAEEEEGLSGRNVRGGVAAVAAAVAASAASLPDGMGSVPLPETIFGSDAHEGGGDGAVGDLLHPTKTRSSARIAQVGSSSRRVGERLSPMSSTPPATEGGGNTAEDATGRDGEQGADLAVPSASAAEPAATGRTRSVAAVGPGGVLLQGSLPGARQGAARPPMQPPPGRTRRRKSLPERIPPLWESLKHQAKGRGSSALAATAPPASASAAASSSAAADGAPGQAPSGSRGDAGATMSAAELALRHCLGSTRLRRWCMYEFFYSALDRPWFMRNELMEFCLHMQLPTTKLTRVEWSFLRSALGRPRRLSLAFLREERLRLEGYRAHARMKYEEVTSSMDVAGLEVPPELPRQLRVGQEVTARHYISRQLHDGVILTVKGNKYRVQFHRGDLMTEVIRDTEVMPLDPHECMPLNIPIMPSLLNGRSYDAVRLAGLRGLLPNLAMRSLGVGIRPLGSWTTGLDTQLMRDQDAMMVAEVQRALEMKETLVARLTQLNNEAQSGLHTDELGGRTEHFQLQYTTVVLQLKETNAVLEGALNRLQGRQQQVINAANNPYGAILALQQQHPQQQQHGAAAAVAIAVANGLVPGGPGGAVRMIAGPPASSVPQAQPQALPNPQVQAATPSAQQQQQQQVANGSPTTAAITALQVSAAVAPQHARSAGPAKAPVSASSHPPLSPSVPLVLPLLRTSTSAAPAAAASQSYSLTPQPLQLSLLLPTVSSEQLVVQALAEARTVVEVCRGKGAEPTLSRAGMLTPPPAQAVPLVAPMLTMQAPGGAAVPLILPPGAVLPQQSQILLQQPAAAATESMHQDQHAPSGSRVPIANGGARSDGRSGSGSSMMDGVSFPPSVEQGIAELSASESQGQVPCIKMEEGPVEGGRQRVEAPVAGVGVEREYLELRGAADRPATEEELAESWLREVIVGCVGVLFTIQKCTAGNVPAGTVAEALDLAVQQVQLKSEGENEALYRDIVQSVQGLKDNLTRALA